jgi:hypothetical protein
VTELQRLGVKVFCEDGDSIALPELIPVFHRWIQRRELDQLLIDVADYSHVAAGPGVLLVAHEGNYGMDEGGGRRGLVYYAKQSSVGGVAERLKAVCRTVLTACERLAGEPELEGRLRFRGDEVFVFANDRLLAPNTDETFAVLEPAVRELAGKLYPGEECTLAREADPKERFAVTVSSRDASVVPTTLLSRLD